MQTNFCYIRQKKGNLTQDDIDAHTQMVELVGKHITECENLEKRRYQSRAGGRGGNSALVGGGVRGTQMGEIRRNVEANDHLDDIDPEVIILALQLYLGKQLLCLALSGEITDPI